MVRNVRFRALALMLGGVTFQILNYDTNIAYINEGRMCIIQTSS